jgi:hypothetical protein
LMRRHRRRSITTRPRRRPYALGIELDAEADAQASSHVPLLVRVLEWVNSPLGNLSDRVREALGKVALVTTMNAVAVLTYVLIFRR